jgi:hypothetical protein
MPLDAVDIILDDWPCMGLLQWYAEVVNRKPT